MAYDVVVKISDTLEIIKRLYLMRRLARLLR